MLTAATTTAGSDGSGGGGGEDHAGMAVTALGSSVPASLRRRLQQSIALGRRVNELERQCTMACESRDAALYKAGAYTRPLFSST